MSYYIQPVEQWRCIFLSYAGDLKPGALDVSRRDAKELLHGRRWNRMIIDVTHLSWIRTPPQLLALSCAWASEVPQAGRVALVVRPEQACAAGLLERHARSKRVFLTYFTQLPQAIQWVTRAPCRAGPKHSSPNGPRPEAPSLARVPPRKPVACPNAGIKMKGRSDYQNGEHRTGRRIEYER